MIDAWVWPEDRNADGAILSAGQFVCIISRSRRMARRFRPPESLSLGHTDNRWRDQHLNLVQLQNPPSCHYKRPRGSSTPLHSPKNLLLNKRPVWGHQRLGLARNEPLSM